MKNVLISLVLIFGFSNGVHAAGSVATETSERTKKFVDFDISGSAGNYNGKSYTEVHAGMNLNFTDHITWRNSVFKRMTSGAADTTGLDSSLRLSQNIGVLHLYAGPGYRWTSDSNKNALLGEAGAAISTGPVTVGAGAKYLRYDQAQYDASGAEIKRDDFSYFVTISGGYGISF